jgi:hypothetical protein
MPAPAGDTVLDRLVAANDLDELVREVDRRTDARDWDGLVRLRDRSRSALERGFQLWPAASLAEYRLALRAPGAWAGAVVQDAAGRFALGPLTEVAASTHTWDELSAHLPDGPLAGVVAHERVVRGEDLRTAGVPFADLFDLPLALEEWEPRWPVATYGDNEVSDPRDPLPRLHGVRLPAPGALVDDPDVTGAFLAAADQWVTQSNGRADAIGVAGDARAAIATLAAATGLEAGSVRLDELEAGAALAQLAWAGASGGAHGRRRGAAIGRDVAWGCATALGGVDHLGDLRWFVWDDGAPPVGWHLHVAVEDRERGLAWALRAVDVSDK